MGSFPETYNDPGSRQLDKEYINADDVKGGAGGGGGLKNFKMKRALNALCSSRGEVGLERNLFFFWKKLFCLRLH